MQCARKQIGAELADGYGEGAEEAAQGVAFGTGFDFGGEVK